MAPIYSVQPIEPEAAECSPARSRQARLQLADRTLGIIDEVLTEAEAQKVAREKANAQIKKPATLMSATRLRKLLSRSASALVSGALLACALVFMILDWRRCEPRPLHAQLSTHATQAGRAELPHCSVRTWSMCDSCTAQTLQAAAPGSNPETAAHHAPDRRTTRALAACSRSDCKDRLDRCLAGDTAGPCTPALTINSYQRSPDEACTMQQIRMLGGMAVWRWLLFFALFWPLWCATWAAAGGLARLLRLEAFAGKVRAHSAMF